MKWMKRLVAAVLCVTALAVFAGCKLVEVDEGADKAQVIATVNGVEITKEAYLDLYSQWEYYYAMFGMDTSDASIAELIQQGVVDALVQTEVVNQKAVELGIAPLTDEEFDAAVRSLLEMYYLDTAKSELGDGATDEQLREKMEQMFEEELVAAGYDKDEYLASYRKDQEDNHYYTKLKEYVQGLSNVSDEDVRAWYDAEVEQQQAAIETDVHEYETTALADSAFVTPEGYAYYKLIDIVLSAEEQQMADEETTSQTEMADEMSALIIDDKTKNADRIDELEVLINESKARVTELKASLLTRAQDIHSLARNGVDFDQLIEENGGWSTSATEYTKAHGYLIGEGTTRWDSEFPKLAETALALEEVGSMSAIVETDTGYIIVKKVGVVTPGVVSYESVKDYCYDQALIEKKDADWNDSLATWTEEADVVVNDKALENLSSLYAQ